MKRLMLCISIVAGLVADLAFAQFGAAWPGYAPALARTKTCRAVKELFFMDDYCP
jgi:hypothetical protein